jgi:hypothetical protein
MSSAVPLLQILFCLVLHFMPAGTAQFTVAIGAEPKIVFTQQAGGTWKGKTDNGDNSRDLGTWSANGLVLTCANQGRSFNMDLSKFLNIYPENAGKSNVTINGVPVTVVTTGTSVTFTQGDGGWLKQPAVITWPAK